MKSRWGHAVWFGLFMVFVTLLSTRAQSQFGIWPGLLPILAAGGLAWLIVWPFEKEIVGMRRRRRVAQLEAQADADDAEAMYRLAVAYEMGDGVDANDREAARLYGQAAKRGHPEALYEYAMCLRDGRGVKADAGAAALLFERAADAGDEAARHRLDELRETTLPPTPAHVSTDQDGAGRPPQESNRDESGSFDKFSVALLSVVGVAVVAFMVFVVVQIGDDNQETTSRREPVNLYEPPGDQTTAALGGPETHTDDEITDLRASVESRYRTDLQPIRNDCATKQQRLAAAAQRGQDSYRQAAVDYCISVQSYNSAFVDWVAACGMDDAQAQPILEAASQTQLAMMALRSRLTSGESVDGLADAIERIHGKLDDATDWMLGQLRGLPEQVAKLDQATQNLIIALDARDEAGAKAAIRDGADTNVELAGRALLFQLVRDDDVWGVRVLLDSGADVTVRSPWNRTLLHEAAIYGHFEIAELLIAHGADVNAINGRGETPLFYASGGMFAGPRPTERHAAIQALLRKHGCTHTHAQDFTISFPSTWTRREPKGEARVIGLSQLESPSDVFQENVVVSIVEIDATINAMACATAMSDGLAQKLKDYVLISREDASLGDLRMARIQFEHTLGNNRIWVRNDIVVCGSRAFIIACTALKTDAERFLPTFDQVRESFKLK